MEKDMSSDILTEELEAVIYYLYVCMQKFVWVRKYESKTESACVNLHT